MIQISSLPTVSAIGKFLRDQGYDVPHLSRDFDLSDGLYANRENLDALLARTAGDSTLAVLARLFFACWPVEQTRCRAFLPDSFLEAAVACGLLTREHDSLASSAFLTPFRSHIIACDSSRIRSTLADMVIGPGPSTNFLTRLAVGGADESTLDLGTGTGALALEAARYSRRVVGTDINPRTLEFAAFNAALNDVAPPDWRCGDAFAPVEGERFTRIIANPPFFLSPVKTFTYCDSPLELDGFSALLARESPAYLEEGGYFQMICEWVDIEGEPWEQRLRQWTQGSRCDVLVLIAPRLTPLSYTEKRTKEGRLMQSAALEHSFAERLRYLTDRHVKQVIGGVITMRKRSGAANWFTVIGTEPAGTDIGQDIRARFDSLTFLATSNDDRIFTSRFQMADGVVLEQRTTVAQGDWQSATVDLVKTTGLVDRVRLDETVGSFLPLFNGTNTVAEIAATVSERLQISVGEAQQRCLQLSRRLLQSNFVTCVEVS